MMRIFHLWLLKNPSDELKVAKEWVETRFGVRN